jgi:hypothetical protein
VIANCALIAAVLLLFGIVFLAEQLEFFRPYAWLLVRKYSWTLAGMGMVVFINLFALVFLVGRRVLLKGTGRKLAHVEKQLRTRDTIVRDLSERLAREE